MSFLTNNTKVKYIKPLISSYLLKEELPLTSSIATLVADTRQSIHNILRKKDNRLLVIVGPCSIHDPKAAIDYAKRLKKAIDTHQKELCIVMRVYFEKPRTTMGWKGLINDPTLDNRFNINQGLKTARQLLLEINALGVPTGSEFLDTIIPQYLSDLTSWAAIGARTTESQLHRELASGLSMPVGFKNSTRGSIDIAVDAVYAASQPHHFLGVSSEGTSAIVSTQGNADCHIILRGSTTTPNYDPECIEKAQALLRSRKLPERIMIDCSHGNSGKDHTQQKQVITSISQQRLDNDALFGVMIESNLVAGQQTLENTPLVYGQSITDACVDWQETKILLQSLKKTIQQIQ